MDFEFDCPSQFVILKEDLIQSRFSSYKQIMSLPEMVYQNQRYIDAWFLKNHEAAASYSHSNTNANRLSQHGKDLTKESADDPIQSLDTHIQKHNSKISELKKKKKTTEKIVVSSSVDISKIKAEKGPTSKSDGSKLSQTINDNNKLTKESHTCRRKSSNCNLVTSSESIIKSIRGGQNENIAPNRKEVVSPVTKQIAKTLKESPKARQEMKKPNKHSLNLSLQLPEQPIKKVRQNMNVSVRLTASVAPNKTDQKVRTSTISNKAEKKSNQVFGGALKGLDADMVDLLRQFNGKFSAPKYEPAMHSIRRVRAWEKATGKVWSSLSSADKELTNREISLMKNLGN